MRRAWRSSASPSAAPRSASPTTGSRSSSAAPSASPPATSCSSRCSLRPRPLVGRPPRGRPRADLEFRISDASIEIGPVLYFILVFLVIAGASNGVNLTDGLDGLAAGSCAIVLLAYTAITFITGPAGPGPALGLPGRCLLGFLWFNSFPGVDLHGGHRLARTRWCDRGAGGDDQDGGTARHHRRHLRDRGALGRDPGHRLQAPSAAASC